MLNPHTIKGRGLSLWAIAAPFLGVPLLVALLALTAHRQDPAFLAPSTMDVAQTEGCGYPSGTVRHGDVRGHEG